MLQAPKHFVLSNDVLAIKTYLISSHLQIAGSSLNTAIRNFTISSLPKCTNKLRSSAVIRAVQYRWFCYVQIRQNQQSTNV